MDIIAMVVPNIHLRFLKLFGATFFNPEKMANVMESTRQKTCTDLRTQLSVTVVLVIILLIFPALSAYGQYKVVRVTDGDSIKIFNIGKTGIIRLVGIDAPKTSKKRNEPGQQFSQKSTQHLASRVLNKSIEFSLPL